MSEGQCSIEVERVAGYKNPFVVESPEKLSPKQIIDLFVRDFTQIETIKQRKHTFVWGTRGSGKSMMLRYLEPQCQIAIHGSAQKFIEQPEPFLGVYCPCKEGQLRKTELSLLDSLSQTIISEHMLNLMIADRVLNCLARQFAPEFFHKAEIESLVKGITRLFDRASVASSTEETNEVASLEDEPIAWLQALIQVENRKIGAFLKKNALLGGGVTYNGTTSGYHDFLLPFVRAVGELSVFKGLPIYLLLDDADKLTRDQQAIVNTWIANRDQSIFCLKISTQREEYKTFYTRDSALIEQPHDYSEVDVDELYTRSQSDYESKVRMISERRLRISGREKVGIEDFLPHDPTEEKLFNTIKEETAAEWEKVGWPGRQSDFVYRYATARLFQRLAGMKQPKSYAGFQNIVHLSSGVIRDFLEPCYLMFDACVRKGTDPGLVNEIPPSIQNDIMRKYSEDFLLKLENIRKDLPTEQWKQLDALKNLIESLGRLFYQRLHDPESREVRLFSFTVRGPASQEIEDVLRMGIRYRYFQLATYSTKEGGGREMWYILNRRLCPALKLDPTGFEGRISIVPAHLSLALKDPAKFVNLRLKLPDQGQPMLFELE